MTIDFNRLIAKLDIDFKEFNFQCESHPTFSRINRGINDPPYTQTEYITTYRILKYPNEKNLIIGLHYEYLLVSKIK